MHGRHCGGETFQSIFSQTVFSAVMTARYLHPVDDFNILFLHDADKG